MIQIISNKEEMYDMLCLNCSSIDSTCFVNGLVKIFWFKNILVGNQNNDFEITCVSVAIKENLMHVLSLVLQQSIFICLHPSK
jgi:hypothetical protein